MSNKDFFEEPVGIFDDIDETLAPDEDKRVPNCTTLPLEKGAKLHCFIVEKGAKLTLFILEKGAKLHPYSKDNRY